MTTDRKILSGFAGGVLFTVVSIGVGIFQLRFLLHYLSEEAAGVWILFTTFGNYVALFDLGVGPTLGREISFAVATHKPEESGEAVGSLVRTGTFATSAIAGAVFLGGFWAGWAYLRTVIPHALTSASRPAWIIFLIGACINLVGQSWLAGIFGLGETLREKQIRTFGLAFGFALFVVALVVHPGLVGIAIAFVLQALVTVLAARASLLRARMNLFGKGKLDFATLRRLAIPSLKYAGTVLGGILILQTDNLVIASRLGTGLIPNYQAASRLVTTMMALTSMLAVTASPFQAQAHAQENVPEIKRLLARTLKYSLGMMAIFAAMLACFSDRIIDLWLGPGHFVGFPVVWALLVVMLLEAHHTSMATATMATGRIVFTVPALLAGVLNIVFSVYLAGKLGLFGVALGTFCAQIVTNNWYAPWYTMRQFHISLRAHAIGVLLPVLLLLGLLLAAGYGLRILVAGLSAFPAVVVGCGGVALAGLAASLVLILSPGERTSLAALLPRKT